MCGVWFKLCNKGADEDGGSGSVSGAGGGKDTANTDNNGGG